MKYKIKIEGLDCANCANELEEIISEIEGVESCSVSFANMLVFVTCNEETLEVVKNACNNFEEVKVVEDNNEENTSNWNIISLVISICLFIFAFVLSKFINHWINDVIFVASYFVCGYSVIKSTVKNILKGKLFDECFLMTLASLGAMAINQIEEGAIVMILYQLGEYLQNRAVSSSRKQIMSLVDLKVEEANIVVDGEVKRIKSCDLKIGDIIQIRNGEKVPVDSVIVENSSAFDTKSLTGEALLKDFKENDEILASYINQGKVVNARVVRNYENSAISRILNLIENPTESKAKSEKFISKFAKFYTPIVCLFAFVVGVIVPCLIGLVTNDWNGLFSNYLYRALVLLVISCPCALVISVPLTYFCGIGVCAKNGILVKGANYLDVLSSCDTICFDKTGTLTEGNFEIVNYKGDEALLIAASGEKGSNHPLAKAFESIESSYVVSDVEEISGKGLRCKCNNDLYLVGNSSLLEENEVKFDRIDSISTVIYVSKNNELIGYIEIDDVIKEDASLAIEELKELGFDNLIMLSGDNQNRVNEVNKSLNLSNCYGQLLPEQKLEKLNELKKQGNVVYVGDGINDSPVMVNASCSFSMGKIGSDVAIESSDIVLIEDDLTSIPMAIKISRRTKKIVLQNIVFSIICKVLFMVLGVLNIMPLSIAIFADVGVMLIAVLNSFRVKVGIKDGSRN